MSDVPQVPLQAPPAAAPCRRAGAVSSALSSSGRLSRGARLPRAVQRYNRRTSVPTTPTWRGRSTRSPPASRAPWPGQRRRQPARSRRRGAGRADPTWPARGSWRPGPRCRPSRCGAGSSRPCAPGREPGSRLPKRISHASSPRARNRRGGGSAGGRRPVPQRAPRAGPERPDPRGEPLRQEGHPPGPIRAGADRRRERPGVAGVRAGAEEAGGGRPREPCDGGCPGACGSGRQKTTLSQAEAAILTHGEQVKGRESQVAIAKLTLGYATLVAPADGFVTRKAVEAGNQFQAGQPLLAVVSLSDLSIVANYKETQIHSIKPGQPVRIRVDALPGREFTGRVQSVMAGTGAAFSLFPPKTRAAITSRSCSAFPSRSSSTRARGPRRSCAWACPSTPRSSPMTAAEKGPSAALHSSWLPAAGTSPPQHPLRPAPCTWTLLISLSETVTAEGWRGGEVSSG